MSMTALPRCRRQSPGHHGADRYRQRLGIRPAERVRDGRRSSWALVRLWAVFQLVAGNQRHAFHLRLRPEGAGKASCRAVRTAGAGERTPVDRPFRHRARGRDAGVPPRGAAARRAWGLGRKPGGHGRHRHHRVRAIFPGVSVRAVGRQDAAGSAGRGDAGLRRARHERGSRRSLLVGCGRMGSAMLAGWREQGLAASFAVDPAPEAARNGRGGSDGGGRMWRGAGRRSLRRRWCSR